MVIFQIRLIIPFGPLIFLLKLRLIFLYLVKQDKILTKVDLSHKCWIGDTTCCFCDQPETVDHLFFTCHYISTIWSWIAIHNGFTFNCTFILDLWDLDRGIPLRDRLLLELIRAATLWLL